MSLDVYHCIKASLGAMPLYNFYAIDFSRRGATVLRDTAQVHGR